MKYTFVDTCFDTHHLQFGFDKDDTLWTSGGGPVVGWLDTKVFDETGDAAKAQGWTVLVLDTDGNGKRDAAVEPDQPVDPQKDKRIPGGFYAIMPSPVDGSVWGTVGVFAGKGAVVRLDPGPNPPATVLAEIYNVPLPGFGPRGADIDSKGVVWVSLGSGHLGSFDRRKCKGPLNGPKATGDHCPDGWTSPTSRRPIILVDNTGCKGCSNRFAVQRGQRRSFSTVSRLRTRRRQRTVQWMGASPLDATEYSSTPSKLRSPTRSVTLNRSVCF
jgi:hypothetical protein